jgi:hypothetical protein
MRNLLLTTLLLFFYSGLRAQCVPGPITGTPNACIATSTTLSDTALGGVWSSSSPTVASVEATTGVVHALHSGSATISYTLCGSATTTVRFNVDTVVHITSLTGPDTVCPGTTVAMVGAPAGGSWSSIPSFSTISSSGYYTPMISATTDVVTYTYTNACGADSFTHVVTTGISPYAGFTGSHPIHVGDFDTLTSYPGGTWSIGSSSIATVVPFGGMFARVMGVSPGTTPITYTVVTDCGVDVGIDTIRVLGGTSTYTSDSITIYNFATCSGIGIRGINSAISATRLISLFGDGHRDTTLLSTYGTILINHNYISSGTYSVKHLLCTGYTVTDSLTYSVLYSACQDIAINLYFDNDSNCQSGNAGDYASMEPITFVVDSNGHPIDTISATTGLFYRRYGSIGDIYSFRALPTSAYYTVACPASGIITDTITSAGYVSTTYEVGLRQVPGAAFDLGLASTAIAGRHAYQASIIASNNYRTTSATVSLDFNPRYTSMYFTPTPTTISGHTAIWYISSFSSGAHFPINARLDMSSSGSWFSPGDTIVSHISITPTSGDIDISNNFIVRIDSAKSSWDPNYTAVSPEGYIHNDTRLHYTVHFENDGNDTARNIYVLDTLPDNVDPATLRIEAATAAMYVSYIHFGSHTVARFEFPGINLPDSSHHGYCTGFVQFNVLTRSGLANGTVLPNRAGIYFDDNEVVLTNRVTNTILIPSITIASAAGSTICAGDTARFTATTRTTPNTHYQWYVNSTAVGTDTIYYSSATLATGNVVKCTMSTGFGDTTMVLNSSPITMTVTPLPVAGTVSGASSVCIGSSVTLTTTGTGGSWSASNGNATVSGPFVTGVAAGLDTIMYRVTNSCGTATATQTVRVDSTVTPAITISVTPTGAVCAGDTVTFSSTITNGGSTPAYDWKLFGTSTGATNSTYTFVPALGDVISCVLTSTATCPIAATTTSSGITMAVNPSVTPTISITATTDSITTTGQFVTFYATATYGGSATTFQWYVNGTAVAGATNASYSLGVVHDISVYCIMTSNAPCATSGTATSNIKTVAADYLDVRSVSTTLGGIVVAPNPNKGTFQLTGTGLDNQELYILTILDITGRVVCTRQIEVHNGKIDQTVTINDAAPGNYILRLVQGANVNLAKFTIDK